MINLYSLNKNVNPSKLIKDGMLVNMVQLVVYKKCKPKYISEVQYHVIYITQLNLTLTLKESLVKN